MKLQIVARLPPRPPPCADIDKQSLSAGLSALPDLTKPIKSFSNNPPPGKLTGVSASPEETPTNLMKFFHNFDAVCQVKHESVESMMRDVRRQLHPQLHILAFPSRACKDKQEYQLKQDSAPMTFNLDPWLQRKSNTDPAESYFPQRGRQRVKKISSLISLHQAGPVDKADSTAARRPGFIRLSKSLHKKQSSLQISRKQEPQGQLHVIPAIPASGRARFEVPSLSQQLESSKQRIAKIRRELMQIYQMREKPRLKLC